MRTLFRSLSIWYAQKPQTRRMEQIGGALAGLAIAWIFFMAAWGIAGPFSNGHFAALAAMGTGGWNCLRFKTLYAITANPVGNPNPADYYINHPGGVFWDAALVFKMFGRSNWGLRLLGVLWNTLTPFLLYRLGRAIWGPIEGGLCAVAFVVLPIILGFSNYHALEATVMFGCTLSLWGYVRLVQTSQWRYLVASVLGFAFALNHDWPAYMWGAPFLTIVFFRAFVIPASKQGSVNLRRLGFYWATMVTVAALSLGLHLGLVISAGKLPQLLDAHTSRVVGNSTPLSAVLEARKVRIEMMFTGLAILMGKIALPIIALRTVLLRREFELHSLPLLFMAVFQYVHFKGGADVHIFWPQHFALYFALAVGALAATATDITRSIVALVSTSTHLRGWLPASLTLGILMPPLLVVGKDGTLVHRLSRVSGGRYVEDRMNSTVDRVVALRWFAQRFPPAVKAGFHSSWHPGWNEEWEVGARAIAQDEPLARPGSTDLYALDARFASAADIRNAVARYHMSVVGAFFFTDKKEPRADIDGFSFNERPARWLEWFTQGNWEPIRTVTRSPWVTWEWRKALGQDAPVPSTPPLSFDEIRIAHNIAVSQDIQARAQTLRAQLVHELTSQLQVEWTNRTQLLGWRKLVGQPGIELLFLGGVFDQPATFDVIATLTAPPRVSTLPRDTNVLHIPWPPPMPTTLWQEGFLYSMSIPIPHRPGTELFQGYFEAAGVKLSTKTAASPVVNLLVD